VTRPIWIPFGDVGQRAELVPRVMNVVAFRHDLLSFETATETSCGARPAPCCTSPYAPLVQIAAATALVSSVSSVTRDKFEKTNVTLPTRPSGGHDRIVPGGCPGPSRRR